MNNVIIGSYSYDDLTVKAPGAIIRTPNKLPKQQEENNRRKKSQTLDGKSFAEILAEEIEKRQRGM